MSQVKQILDFNFEEEISSGTVIVDFWAEWCGPCRIQGPIIDQLSEKVGDKVKVCKMDVDSNPSTAGKLGIASIPTLIVFKDGKPVKKMIGLQTLDILEEAVAV